MDGKIKVAIVEDNGYYRMALANVVMGAPHLELFGLYCSAEEAMLLLPNQVPDVVVMDINLGATNGIDTIRLLSARLPGICFLVCTVEQDEVSINGALSAGANGYILKQSNPKEVVDAIQEIYFGGSPMSAKVARSVVERLRNLDAIKPHNDCASSLSAREAEILHLLNKGKLNKEIAHELCISLETVRKHVSHIYRKLGVNNRVEMFYKVNGYNLA